MKNDKMEKVSQRKEVFHRFAKNKMSLISLFILIFLLFCALFPQLIAPYDFAAQDYDAIYMLPCKEHIFGCDDLGRDIFSRVVYGCRTSLFIGCAAVCIACGLGLILGCIAGYYSSVVDNVVMRFVDILLALPNTLLGISIVAAFGNAPINIVLAIGISTMPSYARLIRASVMSEKEKEYVEAARSNGASDLRIICKYILPNCLSPIIVQVSLSIAGAILTASGLSFIGLGIAPPTPEWGSMLSSARDSLRDYWHVATFPGLAIMITVFAFNLVGDGLRDALDPRMKN